MKKFNFIKLFAVLFAMLLPFSAFAGTLNDYRLEQLQKGKEEVFDITLQTTPGLAMNDEGEDYIADLTKALAINVKGNTTSGMISVLLNKEPVLNVISKVAENGDLFFFVKELNTAFKASGAKQVKSDTKPVNLSSFKDAFKVNMEDFTSFEATEDTKLNEAIENIIKNTTVEDFDKEDSRFDKAEKLVTQKLTKEAFASLMQSETIKKSIESSAKTGETTEEEIEQMMEMFKKGGLTVEAEIKYYIDSEGYVVGLEAPFVASVDKKVIDELSKNEEKEGIKDSEDIDKEEIDKVDVTLNYFRKTEDDVMNNTFTLDVKAGNTVLASANALVKDHESKKLETEAKATINGETPITLELNGEKNLAKDKEDSKYQILLHLDSESVYGAFIETNSKLKNNKIVSDIDISFRSSQGELKKQDSDMHIVTLNVKESFADKEEYEDFDTSKAIDLENITQADESRLSQAVQELIPSIMQKLPKSVLKQLMPEESAEETEAPSAN